MAGPSPNLTNLLTYIFLLCSVVTAASLDAQTTYGDDSDDFALLQLASNGGESRFVARVNQSLLLQNSRASTSSTSLANASANRSDAATNHTTVSEEVASTAAARRLSKSTGGAATVSDLLMKQAGSDPAPAEPLLPSPSAILHGMPRAEAWVQRAARVIIQDPSEGSAITLVFMGLLCLLGMVVGMLMLVIGGHSHEAYHDRPARHMPLGAWSRYAHRPLPQKAMPTPRPAPLAVLTPRPAPLPPRRAAVELDLVSEQFLESFARPCPSARECLPSTREASPCPTPRTIPTPRAVPLHQPEPQRREPPPVTMSLPPTACASGREMAERPTFRSTNSLGAASGHGRGLLPRPLGGSFCADLVVPAGNDCVFAMPSMKAAEAGQELFVRDRHRQPIFSATLTSDGMEERISLFMASSKDLLAYCKAHLMAADERQCLLFSADGLLHSQIVEDGPSANGGERTVAVNSTLGRGNLLRVAGRCGDRSLMVSTPERVFAAISEPGFQIQGVEHYWLRIAPGVNAGLVAIALLSVDRLRLLQ